MCLQQELGEGAWSRRNEVLESLSVGKNEGTGLRTAQGPRDHPQGQQRSNEIPSSPEEVVQGLPFWAITSRLSNPKVG